MRYLLALCLSFLLCSFSWATVPVQRFPSGTPVQVCQPNDTICTGLAGYLTTGGATPGATSQSQAFTNGATFGGNVGIGTTAPPITALAVGPSNVTSIIISGNGGGADGSPNGPYIYEGQYTGFNYYINGYWYLYNTGIYWRIGRTLGSTVAPQFYVNSIIAIPTGLTFTGATYTGAPTSLSGTSNPFTVDSTGDITSNGIVDAAKIVVGAISLNGSTPITSPATGVMLLGDNTTNVYSIKSALSPTVNGFKGWAFTDTTGASIYAAIKFYNDASFDSSLRFLTWGGAYGGTELMVLTGSSQKVGIGLGALANPSAKLDIQSGDNSEFQQWNYNGTPANYNLSLSNLVNSHVDWRWVQRDASVNYDVLAFKVGDVGIGTYTAIGSKLVVQGLGATSATSDLNVTNSNTTSELFVRSDGNVGIGTTSPTSKVQLGGTCATIGPVGTCWTSTGQLGYCSGAGNICTSCTAC